MAYRPSQKRSSPSFQAELNLAPFLSLFVALIPMLLLTAIFQKVAIVNLYLPTAEEALLEDNAREAADDFTLAIAVTPQELTLLRGEEVLYSAPMDDDRQADLAGLSEALVRVKDEFPNKKDAVLLLDGSILYETIIDIMDAARQHRGRELFPDISLADRVVGG